MDEDLFKAAERQSVRSPDSLTNRKPACGFCFAVAGFAKALWDSAKKGRTAPVKNAHGHAK